jgi:PIN domain nuclease of toxin-antitoxin system
VKLLLDTHTFLWWDNEPARLSPRVLALCRDPSTDLILSVVSAWEIQIKAALGKLTLTTPLPTLIATQQSTNRLQVLPVTLEHVLALDGLPPLHKDPFDRLLIAQARVEAVAIATADPLFAGYSVTRVW